MILKTVKPEFSDTLDELVNVIKQRIDNSLECLWAITQEQSVVSKIKASIESVQVPPFLWLLGIVLIYVLYSVGKKSKI